MTAARDTKPLRLALFSGVAAVLLAGALWTAASFAVGRRFEIGMREGLRRRDQPTGLQVLRLDHHAGLLESSGSAEVLAAMGCGSRANARAPRWLLTYHVEHALLPYQPLVRVHFRVQPISAFGLDLRALVADQAWFTGEAALGYDRTLRADLHALAQTRRGRLGTIELAEGRVQLFAKGEQLQLYAALPHVRVQLAERVLEAERLGLALKLDDRHLLTGTTRLWAAGLRTPLAAADGVAFSTRATRLNDRLDVHAALHAEHLALSDTPLHAVDLEVQSTGLDAASVDALSRLASNSCAISALTGDESVTLHDALGALLRKGFALGVPNLRAQSDDGALSGTLQAELQPAVGATLSLNSQLRSFGQLSLSGATLNARGLGYKLLRNALTPTPHGLRGEFMFERGSLSVNGRKMNPLLVQMSLSVVDGFLREL